MTPASTSETATLATSVPGAEALAEPHPELWFVRRIRVRTLLHELWQFRELIHALAERDLRVRYKQAVLGVAWAVVTPVILMLVFSVVFTKFGNVHTNGVPYVLF